MTGVKILYPKPLQKLLYQIITSLSTSGLMGSVSLKIMGTRGLLVKAVACVFIAVVVEMAEERIL